MHPIILEWRGLTIYSYGFSVSLAVLVVYFLARKRAKAVGIDTASVADLLFFLFLSGIFGARLFYVAQHWSDYENQWSRIFLIQEGGLVWYGGFLAAACAGFLYALIRRWPLLKMCDLFAPLVAIGHGVGRVGCFMNGCCYGRPTDFFWGVRFPGEPFARHPAQLYEALALVGLGILLSVYSTKKYKEGAIFLFYVLGYALIRFFVEFLRGDQTKFGWLTLPQWTSVLLLLGVSALWRPFSRRSHGE